MAEAELDLDAKKPAGNRHTVLYIIIGLLLIGLGTTTTLLLTGKGAPAEQPRTIKEAHYLALEKLTVNFDQAGPARYMQADLDLMAYDPKALEAVQAHMPVVRNDILLLLSAQQYSAVSTREGKEALRQQIKATVNSILLRAGEKVAVDAVYFTNFVMQ